MLEGAGEPEEIQADAHPRQRQEVKNALWPGDVRLVPLCGAHCISHVARTEEYQHLEKPALRRAHRRGQQDQQQQPKQDQGRRLAAAGHVCQELHGNEPEEISRRRDAEVVGDLVWPQREVRHVREDIAATDEIDIGQEICQRQGDERQAYRDQNGSRAEGLALRAGPDPDRERCAADQSAVSKQHQPQREYAEQSDVRLVEPWLGRQVALEFNDVTGDDQQPERRGKRKQDARLVKRFTSQRIEDARDRDEIRATERDENEINPVHRLTRAPVTARPKSCPGSLRTGAAASILRGGKGRSTPRVAPPARPCLRFGSR